MGESNDYGRLLSGNNGYMEVKRLFAGCPWYQSTSKLNGILAQHRAVVRSKLKL